ncbi:MAG: IS5 family transposase [Kosmotogaceae bacterium]
MEKAVFLKKTVTIPKENRWVRIAQLIPWENYEAQYTDQLKSNHGGPNAFSVRTALGALIIKTKLNLSDRETVQAIAENPAMQYLVDVDISYGEAPFAPSMMTFFKERLSEDVINQVNEELVLRMLSDLQESDDEEDEEEESSEDDDEPPSANHESENKGHLILDATCAPGDIRYPTDFHLLNKSREIAEMIIDLLHAPDVGKKRIPRTYRNQARADYLSLEKLRRKPHDRIREGIKKQLAYVKRDIGYIENYRQHHPERFENLSTKLKEKYDTILKVYEQQQTMYETRTHSVPDRIVSIHQPYIRPIVRGKAGKPTEFGIKMNTSVVEGFVFIDYMSFDSFNEGTYLEDSVERYRERFGYYPEVVIADTIYRNRNNRALLVKKGIRISGPALGRKPKDLEKAKERRVIEKKDAAIRNQVEGGYGVAKRKYGLDRIKERTEHTFRTKVSLVFLVMNIDKVLRDFFAHFFGNRVWMPTILRSHSYRCSVTTGNWVA